LVETLHLTPLDAGVIILFLAAILALGFSAKLRDNSILQYLAAGRNLTLPAFVATLVSTWYGGILGVGESVKFYGVGTWLLLGVPYYVFALIYALFLAKRVRGAEQISIPERLADKWGKGVGVLAAALIFLLAVPAAHVLMLGVLVQSVTGWHREVAVIVATLVGTLFLYRGGLLADVRAGMLAFIMMYVGFLLIVGFCLYHFPPAEQFKKLDVKMFDWSGGGGFATVLGFFALGAWTLVDPGFHQRVASASSPKSGRNGVLVCILFWFLFDVLSILTGLYALSLLNPVPEGLALFPALGDKVLPPGLKAVFLCGMLGTILCAMVSYTLVSGATLGRDIAARLSTSASEAQIKTYTRIGFLAACAVAIELALQIKSVVDLWYQWGGIVIGALLIPVCAAYIPRLNLKSGSKWIFSSMALSFLATFSWLIYGNRTDNSDLSVSIARHDFPLGTLIPGVIVSAVILAIGQAAAAIHKHHV
jgi:solute:Na+ symporter, SSS family